MEHLTKLKEHSFPILGWNLQPFVNERLALIYYVQQQLRCRPDITAMKSVSNRLFVIRHKPNDSVSLYLWYFCLICMLKLSIWWRLIEQFTTLHWVMIVKGSSPFSSCFPVTPCLCDLEMVAPRMGLCVTTRKIKTGSQFLLKEVRLERKGRCAHIWIFAVVSLLVDLTNNPLMIFILTLDSCDLSYCGPHMVVNKWFVENCTDVRRCAKLYSDSTQSAFM